MATFDGRYPINHGEAHAMLRGKNERALDGRETRLVLLDDGSIAVKYHWTKIVTFTPDGTIILDTNGHHTKTTRDKINSCLTGGWRVWQIDYAFYLGKHGFLCELVDGMAIMPAKDGAPSYAQVNGAPAPQVTLPKHKIPAPARA